MKVLHTGDLHFCQKHLKWVNRATEPMIQHAETADAVVIAGDLFDKAVGMHEPAALSLVELCSGLSEKAPLLCVYGTPTHDRPGSLDILREIRSKYPIYVADRPVALLLQAGEWYEISAFFDMEFKNASHAAGDGVFLVLPGLNKALPEVMQGGAANYSRSVLQEFAVIADAAHNKGLSVTLASHGTVTGSLTESNYAMVAPDHEFTEGLLFDCGADAVMLNHIHKHQSWERHGCKMAYSSSPARLTHGDNNPHGFLMWDVQPGSSTFELVETQTRNLVEVEFNGPPDIDELRRIASTATSDDAIRIRWNIDEEYAADIDKAAIRALFERCEACKLEPTVNAIQSVRAKNMSLANTLGERLLCWLETTDDQDRSAEMLQRLEMLQTMEEHEILATLESLEPHVRWYTR